MSRLKRFAAAFALASAVAAIPMTATARSTAPLATAANETSQAIACFGCW